MDKKYKRLKELFAEFVDNVDGWVELGDDDMVEKNLAEIRAVLPPKPRRGFSPSRPRLYHCLPYNSAVERQRACDTCDCEHSDGCERGYEYWHQHMPEKGRIKPVEKARAEITRKILKHTKSY